MARNKETPLTFMLPDGQVDLITWEYVLQQLNTLMDPILKKMDDSNKHLENIADKLETFIDTE